MLYNYLSVVEGFGPFDDLINRIRAMQDKGNAYNKWVGYLYKYAPQNSAILNDFKRRVFQPSCMFRKGWADQLPNGLSIPTPAASNTEATVAYKNYMKCLSDGEGRCLEQLNEARIRFMEPGCAFLSPQDQTSYSSNFTVAFN